MPDGIVPFWLFVNSWGKPEIMEKEQAVEALSGDRLFF